MANKVIIISSCNECPYKEWRSETEYVYSGWDCHKFRFQLNSANLNEIDRRCKLKNHENKTNNGTE